MDEEAGGEQTRVECVDMGRAWSKYKEKDWTGWMKSLVEYRLV